MPERIDPTKPNAKGKTVKDYLIPAAKALGINLDKMQAQEEPVGGRAMP